ncbi:MAG: peptidoglycan-binding protein [Clostridia bacterium]|nr:peptidoglycan-binding protein [Clostridia bacterium]
MDIMKTLLIYLSATMAFAVQSTSAPKETPTPSPEPVAVVETLAPDAEETGTVVESTAAPAETSAAAATQKPTPVPVPTITPNMKGYRNLAMGAKGKEVIKLQEKLIEMKYLPEGAADGAYGRQTYNAVKKFQYYNGLRQDGIAGRATQTNLFENPEVVPNPEARDETPAPEATPNAESIGSAAPEDTPNAESIEAAAAGESTPEDAGDENIESELTAVPPELLDQYMKAEETEKSAADTKTAGKPTEKPKEDVTEAPAEETEEPAEEPAEEPTEKPTDKPTEEPKEEATEEPAKETEKPKEETTEEPAKETKEPEEEREEIIENVDLDADVYETIIGSVALNESNGPLEFVATEDGVPVTAKPRLMQNGAKIRVSLDDLCQCAEGWQLTDDGVGTIVLEAAGYTLAIYNEENGCSATVDGTEIPMKDDDLDFLTEGHFINAEFLATALKGEAVWEPEESTLMLRIKDKAERETSD